MADGHVIAKNQRILIEHDVADRTVLNVGPRADANVVHVAANHGTRPDARILANHHVTDNHCRGVDIGRSRNLRTLTTIRPDVGLSSQSCPSLRSNLVSATSESRYFIAWARYIAPRRAGQAPPLQKTWRTPNHVQISSAMSGSQGNPGRAPARPAVRR